MLTTGDIEVPRFPFSLPPLRALRRGVKPVFLLLFLLSLPGILPACWVAGPGPNGEGGHAMTAAEARQSREGTGTLITNEYAVIIWDESRKIEHFIRQADIATSAPDVGFVVPTPATPELAEANSQIFSMAWQMAQPKHVPQVIYRTPLRAMGDFLDSINPASNVSRVFTAITGTLAVAANPSSVRVVQETDVAGYHAVTLAADDVAALSQWLKENGYASNPAAEAWLQPYITAKWKVTAFKLMKTAQEANTNFIRSKAIRMSFPSERPFFPYSEPGDTAPSGAAQPASIGRHLNVAILSQARMTGALKDGQAWPGELQYAGTSTPDLKITEPYESHFLPDQWLTFAGLDNAKDKPELPPRLTCFQDNSNPRPGTSDLYFSPSADASPMQRTVVDKGLPPDYRMDWSHPLSNLGAALILLVIGGALAAYPIWLWRISKSRSKRYRR